jgi:hypothetical protein
MSIYKKLLDFQKLGVSIKPDSTNPAFRSKYADITEVLSKVKPALSKVGITMTQLPTETGLKTILADADSDTTVEGFLPYADMSNSQKLGSSITYNRRYSLVAMLGLEDDDDDGNTASAPAPAMNAEIALTRIASAKTLAELQTTWKMLPNAIQKDPEVLAMKDEMKTKLTTND